MCSPTRYGILTGRYAWRSRLQRGVLGPYDTPLIPPGRFTLPSMLQSRGYRTACVGKWHLGWNWPRDGGKVDFHRPIPGGPTAVGFDSYFGTDVPNYPPYCFIENDRTVGIPSVPKPKSIYGTDGEMLPGWRLDAILPTLTARACDFVRGSAERKKPFFLYLPLTSPHTPLAVAEAWRGKSGLGLVWRLGDANRCRRGRGSESHRPKRRPGQHAGHLHQRQRLRAVHWCGTTKPRTHMPDGLRNWRRRATTRAPDFADTSPISGRADIGFLSSRDGPEW